MTEAPLEARLPEVPGYRIERVLGRGGFGVVFDALEDSGRRVALKVATAGDATAAAQLAAEERALRAVGPAVAPEVHGTGRLPDGSPYLALELLQAPTLRQRLREIAGPMPRAELARTAAALCEAVGAMHAAGYLHLDLKPDNVFLTAGRVRLLDMLTGKPPFNGDPQSVREAHIGIRPPHPSQLAPVPAKIEEVVLRALAKDRARRPTSAVELSDALERAFSEDAPEQITAPRAVAAAQPRLERRQVGLLFFVSASDVGSVQVAVRSVGGELGWAGGGRYAAIFAGEAGQDPVRRTLRAAQALAERKVAVRGVVDLGTVNAQRRLDGQVRYIAPELGREDRYALDTDPLGPLATTAAAEVLADVAWEAVPGREGILVPRPGAADRVQAATVVQLGAGPLVGREE